MIYCMYMHENQKYKIRKNCETMNKVPINVEIIVSGLINQHINTICIKYKILMKCKMKISRHSI